MPPDVSSEVATIAYAPSARVPSGRSRVILRHAMTSGPLVGRRSELAQLDAGLDGALGGRGRSFLIAGEPGIGKTRLADELATRATGRGFHAYWGRCWESGGAPPYWPWTQVLRELLDERGRESLETLLGASAHELAQLLPDLRDLVDDVEPASAFDPSQARFRLFDAVSGLLRRASDQSPLLIVLDDVHSADRPSLLLLQFVARNLRRTKAVLAVTYRDVEALRDPDARTVLADVAREGETLSLPRLGRPEVGELARSRLGAVEDGAIDQLFDITEGNPLFVDEMLRLGRGARHQVPHGINEVIRRRLEMLSAGSRDLLARAAAAGREFEVEVVRQALGERGSALDAAVAEARDAGIIEPTGQATHRFSHVLVRDALYGEMSATERTATHRDIAAVLESGAGDGPVAEVAHHLLEAETADTTSLLGAVQSAATEANDRLAYEAAIDLYTRALHQIGPELERERAELHLGMAEAQSRAGSGNASRRSSQEAARVARALGDARLLTRAALAYGTSFQLFHVDRTLVELLETGLSQLGAEESTLVARAKARLAAALQPATDPNGPMTLAREAIEMAQRLGNDETELDVLHAALSALTDFADPRERRNLGERALRLADDLGDKPKGLRATARLVIDCLEGDDLTAADTYIDAYERRANEFAQSHYHWRTFSFRAARAMLDGRFEEAEAFADRAEELATASSDPNAALALGLQPIARLRTADDRDALLSYAPKAAAAFAQVPDAPVWQALCSAMIHARAGQHHAARAALDGLPDDLGAAGADPLALALQGEPAALVGDRVRARRIYERLAECRDRNLSWGMTGMAGEGPITFILGLLASSLGESDDARKHYQNALERTEAMPPHRCRALYELAKLEFAEGNRQRAGELAAVAGQIARRLGMKALLEEIEQLEIAPAAREQTDDGEQPELKLDGEVWTVRFSGESCQLKDSKGLRILAALLAEPGREFHAIELGAPSGAADVAGDSGEVLDEVSKRAYQARVDELSHAVAEAEQFNDPARAAKAKAELEFLADELSRGVGLGGRLRKAGSTAERARVNVQRRLKDAIGRISQQCPKAGRHLTHAVRTGVFCSYEPERAG